MLRLAAVDPEDSEAITRIVSGAIISVVQGERERCAKICDEGAQKHEGEVTAVLMTTADLIRNPVE